MTRLRFHWSLSSVGDPGRAARPRGELSGVPPVEALARFCRQAEQAGIDSLLTAYGVHRADPMVLAAALGARTRRVRFMVAARPGLMSPLAFVQQVNTLSTLIEGRVCLNVVAGHTPEEQRRYGDFLPHDERYARSREFLAICHALWRGGQGVSFDGRYFRLEGARASVPFLAPGRAAPEVFVGGNSPAAAALAIEHGDCLWRVPEPLPALRETIAPLRAAGKEAGLLLALVARRTRAEAREAARAQVAAAAAGRAAHEELARRSDSVAFTSAYRLARAGPEWLSPTLWTGAVPVLGAPSIALVGSYDEVAEAILELSGLGVSQFLFTGWPDEEELTRFAAEVRPRLSAVPQPAGAP